MEEQVLGYKNPLYGLRTVQFKLHPFTFFEESGRVFEDICQQYLYHPQIYTKLPFLPGNTGRWWGTDPVKKRQEEIDIMAIQDNQALLCECKWRNVPVNIEIMKQLLDRGKLFHYDQIFYFYFQKTVLRKRC